MPTGETFRWAGWRHGGAASEPEPVLIRCARCAFVAEGDLEQARRLGRLHSYRQQPGNHVSPGEPTGCKADLSEGVDVIQSPPGKTLSPERVMR